MRYFFLLFSLLFVAQAQEFDRFDSKHALALDGLINEGQIKSFSNQDFKIKKEIKEQLKYTIGQFNGENGGSPDISKLTVTIINKSQIQNSQMYKIKYRAQLFIAWPIEKKYSQTYQLFLPTGGDDKALAEFTKHYGSDEKNGMKCLDSYAHDVTSGIFWYYYRPKKYSCPIALLNKSTDLVQIIDIELKKSSEQTTGKTPEYKKIWEDNKLIVTNIFGKATEFSNSSWDEGLIAFEDTVKEILYEFGQPSSSNIESVEKGEHFQDGLKHPEVHLFYEFEDGTGYEFHLFLIDGIRLVGQDFITKYNELTQVSDFISYSGHSGLGANIRALANMGTFVQGQYQLFLINGCDTFSYVDDALFDAHQTVNPSYEKTKFLDIITNAMPSYFSENMRSNMTVIKALVSQDLTYQDILSGFDFYQRAVVTGEEDNSNEIF